MEESTLWLQTDYFEGFRCKGGACRNSCCEGWRISVSMQEYFRLIGLDCSEKLHRRLEGAFVEPEYPTPEKFRQIAPNWLGKCPMHDENGLCMLHSECGEAALPEICRVYPRSLKREGCLNQACCSSSCEAVIEILMDERQLHFCLSPMQLKPEYTENRPGDMMKTCARCMWALQDRDVPLRQRIRNICALLGCGNADCAGVEPALSSVIEIMKAVAEESPGIRRFGAAAMEKYAGDADAYRADIALFEKIFPRWESWFENILANHLLYCDFPFTDDRIDAKQACSGLCLLYGLMRVMCAPCTHRDDVVDTMGGIFRLAEHSSFYYNARLLGKADMIAAL